MEKKIVLYERGRALGIKISPPFPHFKPHEVEIMRAFLDRDILRGEYRFDVRLFPEVIEPAPEAEVEMYFAWHMLKAKRVDAVCETPDAIWLLEVKDVLRPSAIGELLTYRTLYDRQFRPLKPLRMGVVCGEDDELVRPTCEEQGIRVWVLDIPSPRKRLLR